MSAATLPEYAQRRVTVEVQRLASEVHFTVRDEGSGFDWRRYMDIDPARAFSPHGRGIAMAQRLCFDRMIYRGRGNEVVCTVRSPCAAATTMPVVMPFNMGDMSDDLALARVMQSELLPSAAMLAELERGTGFHVSGMFQPSTDLGGDIWGVVQLDEHRLAIYLADFSGHGITAALNTFRLDTLIEHMPTGRDKPAEYLVQINQQITGVLPVGHYCAMLYGMVDARTSLFTYAAAAATRPLVIDLSSRRVWEGDGKGLPLGISESATYEERQLPFPAGSLLFLYSDALSEARPLAGKPVGCSGVAGLLRRAVEDGVALDAASIIEAIMAPSSGSPRVVDDLTAICCRRSAPR